MGKTLGLVAVRLKSSRLPKKALRDLAGEAVLVRLMERVRKAATLDEVIICTSTHPQDDAIEELAKHHGYPIFRGDELDVMGRFLEAAKPRNADIIVRITGDNPLTDPAMIDTMVTALKSQGAEYAFTEDLPRGTRAEVISLAALERCYALLEDPASSEYMTLMIKRPDHFKVLCVEAIDKATKRPELRLTIDTPQDYEVVSNLFEAFDGAPETLEEAIAWLDSNPGVRELNAAIEPREIDSSINVRLKGDG